MQNKIYDFNPWSTWNHLIETRKICLVWFFELLVSLVLSSYSTNLHITYQVRFFCENKVRFNKILFHVVFLSFKEILCELISIFLNKDWNFLGIYFSNLQFYIYQYFKTFYYVTNTVLDLDYILSIMYYLESASCNRNVFSFILIMVIPLSLIKKVRNLRWHNRDLCIFHFASFVTI